MRTRLTLAVLAVLLVAGAVGTRLAESGATSSFLRSHFPRHQERILKARAAGRFAEVEGEFRAHGGDGQPTRPGGLQARIARETGAVTFHFDDGPPIQLFEPGLTGIGQQAGAAVAFPRENGAAFWRVEADGFEEWLVATPQVDPREPVVSWELRGGTARQSGAEVEVSDQLGTTRLRVSAPLGYRQDGTELALTLVAEHDRISLFADGQGQLMLIDPAWTSAGSLQQARRDSAAAVLRDGRIIVVGGTSSRAVDLYDRATNSWSPGPPLISARERATATTLLSGAVLVTGGINGAGAVRFAELWRPDAGAWVDAGYVYGTSAIRLGSGKVLLVWSGTNTAQVYDPADGGWTATGNHKANNREMGGLALLPDGRVLLHGGTVNFLSGTEVYDPGTNTWGLLDSSDNGRMGAAYVTLLDGGVMAVAGNADGTGTAVDHYDLAQNLWVNRAKMLQSRIYGHTATVLPNGNVLVAGGYGSSGCSAQPEIYSPSTNTWVNGPPMREARCYHVAAPLGDGRVLLAGGERATSFGSLLSSAELYDPTLGVPCSSPAECLSGFCADGVCCDRACGGGPCDACRVDAGALTDGICRALVSAACDDGNGCTQTDRCNSLGVCNGSNLRTCTTTLPCKTAYCDAGTGACALADRVDGFTCGDGNPCTTGDSCQGGTCTGAPKSCTVSNPCLAPTCDPANGTCGSAPVVDGTACNDGRACTSGDRCVAGSCQPTSDACGCTQSSDCPAPDGCHDAPSCNTATGQCVYPAKADGTLCSDGKSCTTGDRCAGGFCVPTADTCPCSTSADCRPLSPCHSAGACDAGRCTNPVKTAGSACDDFNPCTAPDSCQGGACSGTTYSCTPGPCEESSACAGDGGCVKVPKANGTACTGADPCKQYACQAGQCQQSGSTACTASDECHLAGSCGASGCSNPAAPDGTPCSGGACRAGVCDPSTTPEPTPRPPPPSCGSCGGGASGKGCGLEAQYCHEVGGVCCNGMTCQGDPDYPECRPPAAKVGDRCDDTTERAAGTSSTGHLLDLICCNTSGGTSSTGTLRGPAEGGCNDHEYKSDCTADTECPLGMTCQAIETAPHLRSCTNVCELKGIQNERPCCDGLSKSATGRCGLPSGASCDRDLDCASELCVRGQSTAKCQ